MKRKTLPLPFISIIAWAVINCSNVQAEPALSIKEVSTVEAQAKVVDLQVSAGYGLSINFQKTGEMITQVWLSDPSRIVFSTNSSCSQTAAKADKSSCNGGANVIFIRQIKPINFPNLTSARDGGAQLVVLTNSKEGARQYVFRIVPTTGTPQYTSIVLNPAQDEQPTSENNQNIEQLSKPLQNTEIDFTKAAKKGI